MVDEQKSELKTNTLAILGFIFAFLFPIAGLVLSIISLGQFKKDPNQKGKGLAIAGLVLSIVFIVITIILIFVMMFAFVGVANPNNLLPDRVSFFGVFGASGPAEYSESQKILSVSLINQAGTGVYLSGTGSATGDCQSSKIAVTYGGSVVGPETLIPDGEQFTVTWACDNVAVGSLKSDVSFNYKEEGSDFERPVQGSVYKKLN